MTRAIAPILVVEDDAATRSLLCEMLVVLGYRTASAGSAEEAIELIDNGGGTYSVLLADIALPGMSGITLAEIAIQKIPGLQVIFASGNGFLVADKTDFEFRLLPKPYDLNQLQMVLADVTVFATDTE
ncbi:MAG TPA: response regulator [Noviherbaspirillum sp.]|uniref:response regulator n=1 Tax=Noviherbaspirillum sp. TaxID=1926288 RepID=UPI002F9534CE